MVNKLDIIEITIEKIVMGGEGLAHYNGFAIFVPMAALGDILRVQITSVKKNYARASINEIISPSSDRIKDFSNKSFQYFQGCDFAMLTYSAQLRYKKTIVEDVLKKIGKLRDPVVFDILPSENVTHYRNKVIEPFSMVDGKIITGFFKRKSHDVFEVEENILNSETGNRIITKFKELINKPEFDLFDAYDEKKHTGLLRNIMVRTNSKDRAMVVLFLNTKKIEPFHRTILLELKKNCPEIESLYIALNTKKTNFLICERTVFIDGSKTIGDDIGGIYFDISPHSFTQVNREQTKKLYTIAINLFESIENKIIVDAYAGTGIIGMMLARNAKKVYSIEKEKSASDDARATIKKNRVQNIECIHGTVERELEKLIANNISPDGIVFDPPRKGVDENILQKVAKMGIKEIVYISCNPSTLARDLNILTNCGYAVGSIQPVDMFPQTSHIETVVKLYL